LCLLTAFIKQIKKISVKKNVNFCVVLPGEQRVRRM
jgi:hypothetical protein